MTIMTVKALDTLNQELFQLQLVEKETISDWSIHLLRHLQVLAASFPNCFPPDHVAKLKWDHSYGGLPKWLKAKVAYLKASLHKKTYSDYLQAVREAEREESMELSRNPCSQAIGNTAKPKTTGFFTLQKQGNQPVSKMATMHLVLLGRGKHWKGWRSGKWRPWQYGWGYRRVHGAPCKGCEGCPSGEEALLSLQQPQALYPWLTASESLERKYAVKLQRGTASQEGSPDPSDEDNNAQEPQEEVPKP